PVVIADAATPPLRPGGLAAVAAVICHTDLDDYPAACRALVPALRPGGVFAHVGCHPCFVGAFADRADPARVAITPGYWCRERSFRDPLGQPLRVARGQLLPGDMQVGDSGLTDRGKGLLGAARDLLDAAVQYLPPVAGHHLLAGPAGRAHQLPCVGRQPLSV